MKRLFAIVAFALVAAGFAATLRQAEASNHAIPNPSVEQLNKQGKRPVAWWKTHTGTSRASLTVTSPGHDGKNALHVTVRSHRSGAASWFFEPVTVEPSTTYVLGDHYKSNVRTHVVVDVETTKGGHKYFRLAAAPASPSSFREYRATFTTPKDAKSLTFRHQLSSNGWLTTDSFVLAKADDAARTTTTAAPAEDAGKDVSTSVPKSSTTVAPSTTAAPATTAAPSTTAAPTTTAAPQPAAPPATETPVATGDYYVSPSGSDSNPGTSDRPFRTIQKAADVAGAGKTVIVRDGTYTDISCGNSMVCINRGGSSGTLVTFKAERPGGAKLDGRNRAANGFAINADHVRIEGFEIMNLANPSGSSSGIQLYRKGAGSQIIGNHIHNIGQVCTTTNNGQVGIFVEVDNVTIERNYIHHIGRLAPGEGGCSYSSSYSGWEVHDHGIYLNGGGGTRRNTTIRNNVFTHVQRGWAVQIYNGAVTNLDLSNNTFTHGNPNRDHSMIVIYDMTLTNSSIRNNVFYDPNGGRPISTGGSLNINGTTITNNLTNGRAIADTNLNGATNNHLNTDPKLGSNNAPQPGSPAIDNGATLNNPNTAYNGTPRPQGKAWDIGAHEQ